MKHDAIARRPDPIDRHPEKRSDFQLPAGTTVVSADNHISLSEDIFHDRFPDRLKHLAPRVWREDSLWHIGFDGKTLMPDPFRAVCLINDPVAGGHDLDARREDMKREGVDKEIVFPNLVLALMAYPDREVRHWCYRVYNDYLAELQQRAPGFFYGVGLVDHADVANARETLAEIKAIGLKTFMLPLSAGRFADGTPVSYAAPEMDPFWDAVEEAGLPVCFHIGESAASDGRGAAGSRLMQNFAPFRNVTGQLVFGGILDRHPSLRVVFAEGGINWLPAARQDAEWIAASCAGLDWQLQHPPGHYWRTHFWSAFMEDPLGLALIDKIGADRAMWSIDYPHSEGIYGSCRRSMQQVVEAAGEEGARLILGGNAINVFDLN